MGLFRTNTDDPEFWNYADEDADEDSLRDVDVDEISHYAVRVIRPETNGGTKKIDGQQWEDMDDPVSKSSFKQTLEAEGYERGKFKHFIISERGYIMATLWSMRGGREIEDDEDDELTTDDRLDQLAGQIQQMQSDHGRDFEDRVLEAAMTGQLDVDSENIKQAGEIIDLKAKAEAARNGGTSSLADSVNDPKDVGEVVGRMALSMTDSYDSIGDIVEDVKEGVLATGGTTIGPGARKQPQEQQQTLPQATEEPQGTGDAGAPTAARERLAGLVDDEGSGGNGQAEADVDDRADEQQATLSVEDRDSATRQALADDSDELAEANVDQADGDAPQCVALTSDGSQCANDASDGSLFCAHPAHSPGEVVTVVEVDDDQEGDDVDDQEGDDQEGDDQEGSDVDDVQEGSDVDDDQEGDDVDDVQDENSDEVRTSTKKALRAGPAQSGSNSEAATDGGEQA